MTKLADDTLVALMSQGRPLSSLPRIATNTAKQAGSAMADKFAAELTAAIPGARRYARKLTLNNDTSEDLLQSALLRAWERRHLFDDTNLGGWLRTIVHNTYVNEVRASVRRGGLRSIDQAENSGMWAEIEIATAAPENATNWITLKETAAALAAVPSERRNLIVGIANGWTYSDAAEQWNIPLGTIRSRLSRARQDLRDAVDRGAGRRYRPRDRAASVRS